MVKMGCGNLIMFAERKEKKNCKNNKLSTKIEIKTHSEYRLKIPAQKL
jgi:hypothetical protein